MARFEYVTDPGSRAWWKAVEFQRKRQQLDGGTKETLIFFLQVLAASSGLIIFVAAAFSCPARDESQIRR